MGRGHSQNPVRVVRHFSQVFHKDGRFIKQTPLRFTVHARLLGTTEVNTTKGPKELPYIECGHDHLTEAGAARCLRRLKRQYTALRSRLALQARVRSTQKLARANVDRLASLLPTEVIKRKSLLPVEPIDRRSFV